MRLTWALTPNAPVSFGTITVVNGSIWAARIGIPVIRFTELMVLTVVEPIGPLTAAGSLAKSSLGRYSGSLVCGSNGGDATGYD